MGKALNLLGQTFVRLTVIKENGRASDGKIKWDCKCTCGNIVNVVGRNLVNGNSKSCGCLANELTALRGTKHGHSKRGKITSEYHSWSSMIARCYRPKNKRFKNYGGRGIAVCDRWLNSFENFLEDMGKKPSLLHSIERLEVNGNYCPENCIWATVKEQSKNKQNTCIIEFNGVKKPLFEFAKDYGIHPCTLYFRIMKSGWPIKSALTYPVQKNVRHYRPKVWQ